MCSIKPTCADLRMILALAEQTRQQTDGYFDVMHGGVFNPSGLVKGWAIWQTAQVVRAAGCRNFYVDAGVTSKPMVTMSAARNGWWAFVTRLSRIAS